MKTKNSSILSSLDITEAWIETGDTKTIAANRGITVSRIHQIIDSVLLTLTNPSRMSLKPPYPDDDITLHPILHYWTFNAGKLDKPLIKQKKKYWLGKIESYRKELNGEFDVNFQNKIKLETEIKHLGMSSRAVGTLIGENIYTIDDLLGYHPNSLRCIPNLGNKTLLEIQTFIASHGFYLRTCYCHWEPGTLPTPVLEGFRC